TCHTQVAVAKDIVSLAPPRMADCDGCHDGRTAFKTTGFGCARCHGPKAAASPRRAGATREVHRDARAVGWGTRVRAGARRNDRAGTAARGDGRAGAAPGGTVPTGAAPRAAASSTAASRVVSTHFSHAEHAEHVGHKVAIAKCEA